MLCGGIIKAKSRVLIKPNFLAPARPDAAVLTHPLVLRATVEYVLQKGAFPQVSDSPAMGSFERVISESGMKEALKGLHADVRAFRRSVPVDVGSPFKKIEIAADVFEADVLINLPKLKTHVQMLLTLAVKNLFGCVVGMRKPEWHMRTGVDRRMFARLLVKVAKAANPSVSLMDGVLAMEGNGPGRGGTPREIGTLIGSDSAAALDVEVCRMLGVEPDRLLTNMLAREEDFLPEEVLIDGVPPEVKNFRLPDITPLIFGPRMFHGFMRKHLIQRPECNESLCRLCGECRGYCPAGAISETKEKIQFDYDRCIRCYCCTEVCPHGALSSHEPALGKMLRKLVK